MHGLESIPYTGEGPMSLLLLAVSGGYVIWTTLYLSPVRQTR